MVSRTVKGAAIYNEEICSECINSVERLLIWFFNKACGECGDYCIGGDDGDPIVSIATASQKRAKTSQNYSLCAWVAGFNRSGTLGHIITIL